MVAQTLRPEPVTDRAPAAPRPRRAYGARVIAAVGIALLVPMTLVPLAYLLYGSVLNTEQVTQAGRATFIHFTDAFNDPEFWTDLWHSASLALASGAASAVVGVTIAWIVVQVRPPGSAVIDALMLFSFFMSSFVAAVAYVLLGNPSNGLVNLWLGKLVGHPVRWVNVQSFWGIVFALTVAGVPFVYMLTSAALAGADPALEEAAAMSGARRWRRLRTVTFPLVLPGILTGVFFALVFALEAFVEPEILGAPIEYDTLTTRIYHTVISFPPHYGTSSALAVVLMVILVLLIFAQRRLLGERSFTSFTGKTGSAVPVTATFRRRTRWLLGLIPLVYLLIAVGLPYYALIQISLQPFVSPTVTRLSLHNYAAVFHDPNTISSLRNALYACAVGIVVSLLWMFVLAYTMRAGRFRGRRVVSYVATLPIAVPGIVMGVALLWTWLRSPVPVYGTLILVALAYVVRFSPFVLNSVNAGMAQVDVALEESARMSGAGPLRVVRDIVLPLIRPSLLSGAVMFALFSLRDVNTAVLLSGPKSTVFAVDIWDLWESGEVPKLAAASVLQSLILLALYCVARWATQGGQRRRHDRGGGRVDA